MTTIIQLPDNLRTAVQTWGPKRYDLVSASTFGSQAIESGYPVWQMSFEPPQFLDDEAGIWQSLLMRLEGMTNLLACHNLRRPVPIGTMRGEMVLNAGAAAGARTMEIIASGEINKTLRQGDYLGIGFEETQQVVIVVENATSDDSGIITVEFRHPLRNAFSAGEEVRWNKPAALFRADASSATWTYENVITTGQVLSFIEDWRA